jgi:hypothetical protein
MIKNISYGFGSVGIRNVDNSRFENIQISENLLGEAFFFDRPSSGSSSNNYFINLTIFNNLEGLRIYGDIDNNFFYENTFYNNTNFNLRVEDRSGDDPNGNFFYNNSLGNISKVSVISAPDNYFNYSGWGNTYYNTTSLSGTVCFGSPDPCDYFATVLDFPDLNQISSTVSSLFPMNSFNSLIFLMLGLLIFFF